MTVTCGIVTTTEIRGESSRPIDFRIAVYPNGREIVQGAYQWSQGAMNGITWRDLQFVSVDDYGDEKQ